MNDLPDLFLIAVIFLVVGSCTLYYANEIDGRVEELIQQSMEVGR